MKYKLLLINPPFTNYDGIEGQGGKTAPLNLAYLAAYLRQYEKDVEITILDCEALEMSYDQIDEKIKGIGPHFVALTFPTPVYKQLKEITRRIKAIDQNIKIIVGGPHPTIAAQETMQDMPAIDFSVLGEGEVTFLELIRALIAGQTYFKDIKGIAYRDNGAVLVTEYRPLIDNLDTIPFPARDLLPIEKYYLPPTRTTDSGQAINIISGRGCPYCCTFCMAESVWKRKYRTRSVDNVLGEIEECVRNYQATSFNFHDELFTANKERVRRFCEEIIRRKLDISWVVMARVDSVNDEILKLMRQAGCKRIGFGFESGSQKILDKMRKGATLEQARQAVALCRKNDILVSGAFIIGYIDEDPETVNQTIDFACSLDLDTAAFFVAIPYPGTKLYEEAKARGYIRKDFDWSDFCSVSNHIPPMDLPGLSSDTLLKLKRRAFIKFYLRPKYIIYRLKKIKSLADLKDILLGLNIFKNVLK
ncbi:MAG: radical SAM protein [Candidatus Buchananbacteria bacterium]